MVRAQASELTHLVYGEGAGERTNSAPKALWVYLLPLILALSVAAYIVGASASACYGIVYSPPSALIFGGHQHLRRFGEAVGRLDVALTLSPNFPLFLSARATAYRESGQFTEAVRWVRI